MLNFRSLLSVGALLSATVALTACPPDFEGLDGGRFLDGGLTRVDGGPIDGGPIDGGPIDGGPNDGGPNDGGPNDGGPNDGGLNDGGLNDSGPIDGGPDDGGLDDGGLDDGGLGDGGPIDGGFDAGPPCVLQPVTADEGVTCLSGSDPNGCLPNVDSPVVAIENACPNTFVLHENGQIARLNGPALEPFASCTTAPNAPVAFTHFDVRRNHVLAYQNGGEAVCFATASNCTCEIVGGKINAAALIDDNRSVVATEVGQIFHRFPTSNGWQSFANVDDVHSLTTVTRPDNSFRVLAVRNNGTLTCLGGTGENEAGTLADECPELTNNARAPFLVDVGPQSNQARDVHLLGSSIDGHFARLTGGPPPGGLGDPSLTLSRFIGRPALSYAALNAPSEPAFRAAVGLGGGVVQWTGTTDQIFVSPPGFESDPALLAPIRALTFARTTGNVVDRSVIFAVSDAGYWHGPSNFSTDPTFVPFDFGGEVVQAESLRLNNNDVLAVATAPGNGTSTVHFFQNPTSPFPPHSLSTVTDAGQVATIVGVTRQFNAFAAVVTTSGAMHYAEYNGGTPGPFVVFSAFNFFSDTNIGTIPGNMMVAQRGVGPPADLREHVVMMTRNGSNAFTMRTYEIVATSSGGDYFVAIDNAGTRATTPYTNPATPFRFNIDDSGTAVNVTTQNGVALSIPLSSTSPFNFDVSSATVANPPPNFTNAGAIVVRPNASCSLAFSLDSPRAYSYTVDGNPAQIAPYVLPPGFQLTAALRINAGAAVFAGAGGHLYRVVLDTRNGCDDADVFGIDPPLFDRNDAAIGGLEWRTPSELLVGDARGRVFAVFSSSFQ